MSSHAAPTLGIKQNLVQTGGRNFKMAGLDDLFPEFLGLFLWLLTLSFKLDLPRCEVHGAHVQFPSRYLAADDIKLVVGCSTAKPIRA